MTACSLGHLGIVRRLLKAKANIGLRNAFGKTALQYIFLLRGPPQLTESLAVEALLRGGSTDALLPRRDYLPPRARG